MKSILWLVALVLLICGSASQAHAQSSPSTNQSPNNSASSNAAANPPSPESLALAEKMVDILGFQDSVDQFSAESEKKYTDALIKANPDKIDMVHTLVNKDFTTPLSAKSKQMHEAQVKGFAARYTEQYMKQSIDQFSEPDGQAALKSQQDVMQGLMKLIWVPFVNKCKQDLVADLKTANIVVPVELTQ